MTEALARDIGLPASPATAPARPAAAAPLGARDDVHSGRLLSAHETLLWEGRPSTTGLALRTFRLPVIAAYFAALAGWGAIEVLTGAEGLGALASPIASGLLTLGLLFGLARIVSRTTTYLVTSERLILRYGAVVPRNLSIPFRQVGALRVSVGRGGRGEIALALKPGNRIPYLKLWPHARPWRISRPEVMLRDVADAGQLATGIVRRLDRADAPTPA